MKRFMKKISFVLSVLIVAAIGLNAQGTTILKVKIQTANIRTDPDIASPIIMQVTLGTQLESRQKIGDWYEVVVIDDTGTTKTGFITASVVDVVSAGGAKPAEQMVPPCGSERPPPCGIEPTPSFARGSEPMAFDHNLRPKRVFLAQRRDL